MICHSFGFSIYLWIVVCVCAFFLVFVQLFLSYIRYVLLCSIQCTPRSTLLLFYQLPTSSSSWAASWTVAKLAHHHCQHSSMLLCTICKVWSKLLSKYSAYVRVAEARPVHHTTTAFSNFPWCNSSTKIRYSVSDIKYPFVLCFPWPIRTNAELFGM